MSKAAPRAFACYTLIQVLLVLHVIICTIPVYIRAAPYKGYYGVLPPATATTQTGHTLTMPAVKENVLTLV